ncbi:MAG: glycosyltransferase [Chloroflexota bacterium]
MTAATSVAIAPGATDPLSSSLVRAIADTVRELGLDAPPVASRHEERLPDALISVGLPLLYHDSRDGSAATRQIAWFGEPLPRRPDGVGRPAPFGRPVMAAALRRLGRPGRLVRGVPLPARLDGLRAAAYVERERQVNLAAALRRARAVDLVVVTSRDRAAVLAGFGIAARVVPFGYHPTLAGPIVTDTDGRDIPAVAFGSGLTWSSRRARGLQACAKHLGPDRLVLAGATWGKERDGLLRRSRILLDVHRIPGNFIGLRILFAAAAGAVLVTEPLDDPHPFVPGRHFVEAPLDALAQAVDELLADEHRRQQIVEASQTFITGPLSMAASVRAVLA